MQAVVENHQTYFIDRKSWFAKRVFPEKVDLDVTTTLLVTDTVSGLRVPYEANLNSLL